MPESFPRCAGQTEHETDTATLTRLARPWNVIVHDDPITTMAYVVKVFVQVFRYGKSKAHKLMMEVHDSGCSVVWTGERERAEMFVQKLHSHHLLATVEQSGDE